MKFSIPMMPGGDSGEEEGPFSDVRVGQSDILTPLYNPRRCPLMQGIGLGFLLGTTAYGVPHLKRIAVWGIAAADTAAGLDFQDGKAVVAAYLAFKPRVRDHAIWLRSCLVAAHMLDGETADRQHIAALLAETHKGWMMRGPQRVEVLIGIILDGDAA